MLQTLPYMHTWLRTFARMSCSFLFDTLHVIPSQHWDTWQCYMLHGFIIVTIPFIDVFSFWLVMLSFCPDSGIVSIKFHVIISGIIITAWYLLIHENYHDHNYNDEYNQCPSGKPANEQATRSSWGERRASRLEGTLAVITVHGYHCDRHAIHHQREWGLTGESVSYDWSCFRAFIVRILHGWSVDKCATVFTVNARVTEVILAEAASTFCADFWD